MVSACFAIGGLRLCVDRALLRGVLDEPTVTPMPGAPPWLLGACNRGGRALAVVDVAVLAGLVEEPGAPNFVVVVETSAGPVGLSVGAELGERRGATPSRNGDLLVEAEPGTWVLDVNRLPSSLDEGLPPRSPAL